MKALIQRVTHAKVEVDGREVGAVGQGLLVLLGVAESDSEKSIDPLVQKVINLRVFEDEGGKMNLSLMDVKGQMLIVSQFTLYADTSGGRRPSFADAARPEKAIPLYNKFVQQCEEAGLKVATGEFGAHMKVELINDGPVTIMVEN